MEKRLDLSYAKTEVFFGISGLGSGRRKSKSDGEDFDRYFYWCMVDLHVKNRCFCYDGTECESLTLGET